jgi:hypothetical protein
MHILFVHHANWRVEQSNPSLKLSKIEFNRLARPSLRDRLKPVATKREDLYLLLRPEVENERQWSQRVTDLWTFLHEYDDLALADASIVRMLHRAIRRVDLFRFNGTVDEFYALASFCHYVRAPRKLMSNRQRELAARLKAE